MKVKWGGKFRGKPYGGEEEKTRYLAAYTKIACPGSIQSSFPFAQGGLFHPLKPDSALSMPIFIFIISSFLCPFDSA